MIALHLVNPSIHIVQTIQWNTHTYTNIYVTRLETDMKCMLYTPLLTGFPPIRILASPIDILFVWVCVYMCLYGTKKIIYQMLGFKKKKPYP